MEVGSTGYYFIFILFIVLIILLTREIWTWYLKINKMVKLMENQTDVLNKILKTLNPEAVKRDKKEADKVINEKDKKDINDSDIS